MRTLTAAVAALFVALATPAFAAPPAGGHAEPTHAEAGHADAKTDGHGGEAHGDEHGEAHGDDHGAGHHYYTDDDDGDGVPNWRDSDSGETYVLSKLGFHLFNLILYIGILFAFVRRPLLDTLRTRALEIRTTLVDSHKTRDTAKERHDEVEARLQALADEIAAMKVEADKDAAAEHTRLVAKAHEEAERIAQTAQRNIRDEVVRARNELRQDAVELAVQLAESTLRETVNKDDQKRLASEFLTTLKDGEAADA